MYTFLPHNIFCASVTENTHHDRRHKPSDTDSTPSSTDLQEYVTDRRYIHATDYNMYPSSMQVEQNTRAYQLLDVTLPIIKRRRFDRLAADEGEQMYLLLRSYRKTHGLEDAYLDRIITLSKEIGLLYRIICADAVKNSHRLLRQNFMFWHWLQTGEVMSRLLTIWTSLSIP